MGVAPRSLASGSTDLLTVEKNGAALPTGETCYRVEERRLSVAVESDNPNSFPGLDNEIEIVDDPQWPVTGGQALDFKYFGHHGLNAFQNRQRGRRGCR